MTKEQAIERALKQSKIARRSSDYRYADNEGVIIEIYQDNNIYNFDKIGKKILGVETFKQGYTIYNYD